MKEKNWYELNGWYWDKRDHMWKRKVIDETSNSKIKEKKLREEKVSLSTESKSFTKKHNTLIFNNIPYPLKFHEGMYKK